MTWKMKGSESQEHGLALKADANTCVLVQCYTQTGGGNRKQSSFKEDVA